MNRKITRLAFAGKGDGFAADGLSASAARRPSRANRSNNAQPPKPKPAVRSISRREGKNGRGRQLMAAPLPPLSPVLRGEGPGVRGFVSANTALHPQPLSPEYRGEGR